MLKPQRVRKKVVRKQLQRRKTMKKKRRRRKSKCAHPKLLISKFIVDPPKHEDQRDFAQHSNLLTLRLHGRPDSSPVTVTSIVVTELTLII